MLVFTTVAILSALCLISDILLTLLIHKPSDAVGSLTSGLADAWKLGFGALVGLLGGKAVT
jgi:hypothetical protein